MTSKAGIRKGVIFSVLARNCQPAIKVKAGQFGGIVAISKVL